MIKYAYSIILMVDSILVVAIQAYTVKFLQLFCKFEIFHNEML